MSDLGDLTGEGNQPAEESYGEGFLKNVDPADRPYVEKYLKQWDSGVTQKFQDIHRQYEPYKGLDLNEVESAINIMNLLENDPEFMYNQLVEYFQQTGKPLPGQEQQQFQQVDDNDLDDDPHGARLDQMERYMQAIAENLMGDREARQAQAEDEALEQTLSSLREQHGDFDEDYIMAKMLRNGGDAEKAYADYEKALQGAIDNRRTARPPVPVMGNGGGVPSGGVDVTKLGRGQTQDLVAQMLAHAQNQNH